MDTTIGYLHELREDLLDAAWREGLPEARPRRVPRWRPTRRGLAGALAALVLVSAGLTGWVVTRPDGTAAHVLRALGRPSPVPAPAGHDGVRAGDVAVGFTPFVPGQAAGQASAIIPGDLSRIVKTADLTVVVRRDTFAGRFQAAMDVATRFDGYVQTSSTYGRRAGSLAMRIPAASFASALDALRGLGTVDGQTVTGKDVTASYIDLQARLRIAESRRTVLFGLMAKADTIPQTIRVQNALDDVQLQIEQLQGDLNVLDNQTSKATIRLSMREEGVKPAGAAVENPSIPNAWDRAVAGFFGVVVAVIVGLGYVVPVGLLLFAVALVALRLRRRPAT